MFLKRTLALTVAAALLVVGCGKKNDADAYLDKLDKAVTDATALIKEKKPKSLADLQALPEWKTIDENGKSSTDSLRAMQDKLTPEQKKRFDDINKRVEEMQQLVMSTVAPPTPSTPPTGNDTAAAAPSTTAPATHDTAAHANPADTAHK